MKIEGRNFNCEHCRDQKYVFVYWFERALNETGFDMKDVFHIFGKIPFEMLTNCHCSAALLLPSKLEEGRFPCYECKGTTWLFKEEAQQEGYRWKKVVDLPPQELVSLPCKYFERCPCGYDQQTPRSPEEKKAAKKVCDLLKIRIPRFGFSFAHLASV